ncbi:unnamed protein product [Macrosiphum euphorbiae]|uniref:TTF-type domain-containing protein n=3 Tax=Macrosiphum euphorbiae TaxID=13131 RepID=A0AAV0X5J4_9HEMI|nr:unnamed protein product [Macrosiphum euphorbiae]
MADDIKKRKRLSGSQYLKKRLAREKDLVKQKGSLLKFCQQNSQANVINDNDTDDSEENSGNKNIEDLSMGEVDNKKKEHDNESKEEINITEKNSANLNIKDIHDISSRKADFDSENENKKEIAISIISEENIENKKSCNYDEKYTNFKSLDFDDPNKWPSIDDKLRLYLIECGPRQINMETFPINTSGRSFSSFHYFRRLPNGECIKRSWIIYSKSSDSVFCFCCKLFNIGVVSLTTNGNNDWKNISNILNRHETSNSHKKAYQNWKELETRCKRGKTINNINEANLKIETEHWKNVLKRIIELIKTLSSQNLAFRGKSDKLNTSNNGNFLKFIEFLSKFDPVMKEHIRRISSQEIHCHYLGKDIQNEIIQLLTNKIRSRIITALKNAKYYSIILDCTPDINHTEQMTVIVRFVSTTENETTSKIEHVSINEHFIGFIELYNTTGLNMTEVILQKLRELDISLDDMRGQGYDNGANMRGYKSGVQARIRNLNSRAFYVPCNAHSLNLVLNDSANCCLDAVLFFDIIQEMYTFFSASTQRWDVFRKYVKNLTVKPLSATRWSSRIDAIRPIRFQTAEIYDALEEISEDTSLTSVTGVRSRSEAKGIAEKLISFKFLCSLVIWYDLLCEINVTSKLLQSISLNIIESINQINNTKIFLQKYRSNENFEKILTQASYLANELGVQDSFSLNQFRTRRRKTHFDYESRDTPITDPKQNFKINFFHQILDNMLQSINDRFIQLEDHSKLFSFLYNISNVNNYEHLMKCCKDLQLALSSNDGLNSDINSVELCEEINTLQKHLQNENDPKAILQFICENKLIELFPNVYVALRILLTLPVTAASAERSFSKLKIVKNYLRSQISQDRLVGLATISIENQIANDLDIDDLVKDFASAKARKIHF